MRKQYLVPVLPLLAGFAGVITGFLPAQADGTSPWITSSLNLQEQSEALSLPASINGNIDCYREPGGGCVVPVPYGAFDEANSKARFNSDGGYKPVLNYVENRQRVLAVPNSPTVISYTTNPVFGWNLYFNNNVTSIEPGTAYIINSQQPVYKLSAPPDGSLADKSGNLLPGDYETMSFSANSEWMVVVEPNVTTLRVNLKTLDVLPFGPRFQYGTGNPPDVKTAVTNDGRYAVEASYNQSRFAIYDLDSCNTSAPTTITGPVNCRYRDLKPFVQQQISAFRSATNIRFLDDDTLSFYGSYYVGPALKTAKFILSINTIDPGIPYLALGDSYISGEGAFDYAPGTDSENNTCHLSFLSYPYLINNDLGFNSNIHPSVACSGAITRNIDDPSIDYLDDYNRIVQSKGKSSKLFDSEVYSNFLPGYRAQINFVKRYQPEAITVSIGGNDMGFSKILARCVGPWEANTCYSTYEDRIELVREINGIVFNNLVDTYTKLKGAGPPDMRIYAIGYPQIANPDGSCGANVLLNHDELILSRQLIAYLDLIVQKAADKTGAYYVDTQYALDGHRLCEADGDSLAVNGFTIGDDRPKSLGGPIGDESYHPTLLGYKLLEEKILEETDNLAKAMPAQDSSSAPSGEAGLEILNATKSGREINKLNYDENLTNDVIYDDGPVNLVVNGIKSVLRPLSTVRVVLHSDPVELGQFTTDERGDLTASVVVPDGIPKGFHTLDVYATDIFGQPVDIQKVVYVTDKTSTETTAEPAESKNSISEGTMNGPLPTSLNKEDDGPNDPTLHSEATAAATLQNADSRLLLSDSESSSSVLGLSTSENNNLAKNSNDKSSITAKTLSKNWKIAGVLLLITAIALLILFRFHRIPAQASLLN